jgi:hypothetical protein
METDRICVVCVTSRRPEIDAWLRRGRSLRSTARAFGQSRIALRRHLAHLSVPVTPPCARDS